MSTPRRLRLPDPADEANQAWWQAHDRLAVIAADAAAIAAAATAADARLRAGADPDPDLRRLADALARWCWQPHALDLIDLTRPSGTPR